VVLGLRIIVLSFQFLKNWWWVGLKRIVVIPSN
jgi:hypothetical protein